MRFYEIPNTKQKICTSLKKPGLNEVPWQNRKSNFFLVFWRGVYGAPLPLGVNKPQGGGGGVVVGTGGRGGGAPFFANPGGRMGGVGG